MLIPSLCNFLPDYPCTSRCLDQFSILILKNLTILIQELQEYLDHILLQLVDVVGVLLQGVTNRCLEAYMQKTCDVAEKAILAKKKIVEKVRKSRQTVNRDRSA